MYDSKSNVPFSMSPMCSAINRNNSRRFVSGNDNHKTFLSPDTAQLKHCANRSCCSVSSMPNTRVRRRNAVSGSPVKAVTASAYRNGLSQTHSGTNNVPSNHTVSFGRPTVYSPRSRTKRTVLGDIKSRAVSVFRNASKRFLMSCLAFHCPTNDDALNIPSSRRSIP